MAKILIIDDDQMICDTLSRIFSDMGHKAMWDLTFEEGLRKAKFQDIDVVFLDVRLPDGNGLLKMPLIQQVPSNPEVIIMTGYADPDGAELAIKNNAWDYLKKPVSFDSLLLALTRVLEYRKEKNISKIKLPLKRADIIGNSPEITNCLNLVARAANTDANILLTGETGTGKELFARAIHANSFRSEKNFVVIDCTSIPELLCESLLFGHTKGAFTGADRAEEGLIEHANGGSLFLDEVGELSPANQKTFLRVLQERLFRPIGGTKEKKSDFRLISASNRDLDAMVESGQFREDLMFRIRSIAIHLPPLRERGEDIKSLTVDYLMKLCEAYKTEVKGFSPEFLDILTKYNWPGNVRELFSTLEWAVAQAIDEPTLFPKYLPANVRIHVTRTFFDEQLQNEVSSGQSDGLSNKLLKWQDFRKTLISEGEKQYLQDLILQTGGNIKRASLLSGLSVPRLYELLRKYRISTR